MLDDYLQTLARTRLFASFTVSEIKKILDLGGWSVKKYTKGTIIHFQNEVCRSLDIILDGSVAVQKLNENGNILTISVFFAKEIIGANLLFSTRDKYPLMIVADSPVVILHLYKETIASFMHQHTDFAFSLLSVVADKTLVLTDKIETISLKTIRQRLLEYLYREYRRQGSRVIELEMTKKELAQRLGMQRSSLGRELKKMREEGLLEYDARTITLKELNDWGQ
ncbi:MAG: Crp/Fnr family transcriptional regulator [Firmicutes bacterium]|nr:Crp/Fnr family transcriptional regulator [Bacillota bacterium]